MSQNAGLQFYTPEERFLSRPIDNNWEYDRAAWNPAEYNHDSASVLLSSGDSSLTQFFWSVQIFTPTNSPLIPRGANKKQEVIFFVGPPAIGKTFFFNHYFAPAGYISVVRLFSFFHPLYCTDASPVESRCDLSSHLNRCSWNRSLLLFYTISSHRISTPRHRFTITISLFLEERFPKRHYQSILVR